MQVGLAGQAGLARCHRGPQPGQAGSVCGSRRGLLGDGPASCRGGEAGDVDEVLDGDPQAGPGHSFPQDPR